MANRVPGTIMPYGADIGISQPYGKGAAQPWGKGAAQPWGKGAAQPWGKGAAKPYGKGAAQPWGKGAAKPYYGKGGWDSGAYGKGKTPYWAPTAGGGFAKQYPPGTAGIPYAFYPGYGLVQ